MRQPATTAAPASTGRASSPAWSGTGTSTSGSGSSSYDPTTARRDHRAGRGVPDGGRRRWATTKSKRARPSCALASARSASRDEPAYQRFGTYDIVDPGKWTVTKGADRITFVHQLGDTAGYAYVYRKTLRLAGRLAGARAQPPRTPARRPSRRASTTTTSSPSTGKPTGPDFVVRFPFEPRAARPLNGLAEVNGNEVTFPKTFERRRRSSPSWKGSAPRRRTTTSGSRTASTGAGVRITGNRPLSKLPFWSDWKTSCPGAVHRHDRRAGQGVHVGDSLRLLRRGEGAGSREIGRRATHRAAGIRYLLERHHESS